MQFTVGAVVSTLVTRFHAGDQVTMVVGILACALTGLACFRLLAGKPKPAFAPAE